MQKPALIALLFLAACTNPKVREADASELSAQYLKEIAEATRQVNASLLIGPSMISELYDKLHECQNQIITLSEQVAYLKEELDALHGRAP